MVAVKETVRIAAWNEYQGICYLTTVGNRVIVPRAFYFGTNDRPTNGWATGKDSRDTEKKVTHRSRLYSDGSSKVPTVGRARRFDPLQPKCTRQTHGNP
ncbi:hypothetical protein QF001_000104 [Paraburkholderia youngii]